MTWQWDKIMLKYFSVQLIVHSAVLFFITLLKWKIVHVFKTCIHWSKTDIYLFKFIKNIHIVPTHLFNIIPSTINIIDLFDEEMVIFIFICLNLISLTLSLWIILYSCNKCCIRLYTI